MRRLAPLAPLVLSLLLAACAAQAPESSAPATQAKAKAEADRAEARPAQPAEIAAGVSGSVAAAAEPRSKEAVGRLAPAPRSDAPAKHKLAAPLSPPATLLPAPLPAPAMSPQDRERYQALTDNPVHGVAEAPVSTFSIDVDTGSYANVRRLLNAGRLPPADAVRVEEMINYFPYDYAQPQGDVPFAVHTELARAPWNADHLLLRVALKGKDLAKETLPPANLVFLVDVSGSMNSPDKLPLLKASLKLLVNALRPQDRIALVTYASGTQVVLESTSGSDQARVATAIDALQPGGSTAGASGIELAYRMAQQGFIKGGINRILLATDGDFNVGITDFRQLKSLVEERRKSGISLSTLGFGTGNYNEQLMEQMADAGDGAYSYIDNLMEGHKVLVNEMSSTLATIAQDVKIQVEFNPAAVREYRLIGYENRLLAREDFNNDKVDAGDIGAGHTVTALYELTPAEAKGLVDPLRYGQRPEAAAKGEELAFVKLRYKLPGESKSRLIERAVTRAGAKPMEQAGPDFRFATAVAGFGQVLRGGRYTGAWQIADARRLAAGSLGDDRYGYRAEALRLMDLAGSLATREPVARQEGR
jgi:Ca-activated chloride channel family protein